MELRSCSFPDGTIHTCRFLGQLVKEILHLEVLLAWSRKIAPKSCVVFRNMLVFCGGWSLSHHLTPAVYRTTPCWRFVTTYLIYLQLPYLVAVSLSLSLCTHTHGLVLIFVISRIQNEASCFFLVVFAFDTEMNPKLENLNQILLTENPQFEVKMSDTLVLLMSWNFEFEFKLSGSQRIIQDSSFRLRVVNTGFCCYFMFPFPIYIRSRKSYSFIGRHLDTYCRKDSVTIYHMSIFHDACSQDTART
jgi:hypothetical protein